MASNEGVVVICCRFERYITTEARNKSLSVNPLVYKTSKTHSLLEPSGIRMNIQRVG